MRRKHKPTCPSGPDREQVADLIGRFLAGLATEEGKEALSRVGEIAGGGDTGEMIEYYLARNQSRGIDHLTEHVMRATTR